MNSYIFRSWGTGNVWNKGTLLREISDAGLRSILSHWSVAKSVYQPLFFISLRSK